MKKMFIVSSIMALVVASLSAFSVFAAPASTSEHIFGQQFRELQSDRNFYDHFIADSKNFVNASSPNQLQQDLARYAFALKSAEAIIAGRGTAVVTSKSTNSQTNAINNMDQTAQQNLAMWLHMMRDLRVKISQDS